MPAADDTRPGVLRRLLGGGNWAYALVPFIPIAVGLELFHASAVAIFAASALGIIPTAALMGRATEELADRAGPGIGGLLNVTFGNAPELIIALFALGAGLQEVVKASLVGSILGNILLVLGAAMVVGGRKRERQYFNRTAAALFLPVFWVEDKNGDRKVDPAEIAVLYGLKPSQRSEWVSGSAFTPAFNEAYLAIARSSTAAAAGLAPEEQRRRAAILKELSQGRPTIVASDFSAASDSTSSTARMSASSVRIAAASPSSCAGGFTEFMSSFCPERAGSSCVSKRFSRLYVASRIVPGVLGSGAGEPKRTADGWPAASGANRRMAARGRRMGELRKGARG